MISNRIITFVFLVINTMNRAFAGIITSFQNVCENMIISRTYGAVGALLNGLSFHGFLFWKKYPQ